MHMDRQCRHLSFTTEERMTVDEFISMVTQKLGVGESESRSATGGLLKMLKEQLDDSTFSSVVEKLPGASSLLDEAESDGAGDSGGGGLMGKLTSMAGDLLGSGGGAAGLAKIIGESGISLDKAGGFLAAFMGFLKAKLGDDMFARLASNIPGFGDAE